MKCGRVELNTKLKYSQEAMTYSDVQRQRVDTHIYCTVCQLMKIIVLFYQPLYVTENDIFAIEKSRQLKPNWTIRHDNLVANHCSHLVCVRACAHISLSVLERNVTKSFIFLFVYYNFLKLFYVRKRLIIFVNIYVESVFYFLFRFVPNPNVI